MTEHSPTRPPVRPPSVAPPPPFRERRATFRRAEDRRTHEERVLLARALDVLAGSGSAEERLAGLLDLLAGIAGARRAAVLAGGSERRAAVSVDPGEDPAEAEALAAWLDASAGRSRAERAAAGRAPVSIVARAARRPGSSRRRRALPGGEGAGRNYALLPIPSAGSVFLGFEFDDEAAAGRLAESLSPELARHAAVALALVTEQLATQRELTALRASEAERTRFVSTVAHELRTPLTGLRGYLELILAGRVDDPEVEHDFLERSRAIVDSMADLVGDLLELARLESGTVALDIAPFSVAEAASQVATGLMPIALERGSRLTTTLPPRLRSATADRRRVEQVLTNLAGNALKFTPRGGTVEIVGRFDGPVAVIAVRDDGPGIAPEDRNRIFERFHRLADHERVTGTGLGLPIARDLARRMDGDLDVASRRGAGSAFVLVLPGPAAVDPDQIGEGLRRALIDEMVRLDELAVLRTAGRTRAVSEKRARQLRSLPRSRSEDPAPAA
ncbi:MAG TPA: HAMP domain-containing sensor histidine kinase [Candidatus Limnocylindrales bacterium]|nr:HAMP domain-containing sensor histidine kinase [Candidatus Limnocylindrales bacterium]